MTTSTILDIPTATFGFQVHRLRRLLKLTQQELAEMAQVSRAEVSMLEHNQPVRLDSRRRIFKELWAFRSALTS
jgi:transcriptional regulator with XRE-family HTH domain